MRTTFNIDDELLEEARRRPDSAFLVDTSVWVDHLRRDDAALVRRLDDSDVLMHPFVLGELACGNLQHRYEVLALLRDLLRATVTDDEEVLYFTEQHMLMGGGTGHVDAHLLASASLSGSAHLWTRDQRLQSVATGLELAVE